jgi:hypothetical protein
MAKLTRLSDPAALAVRVAVLERQLQQAQREIVALREARDVAIRVAAFGGRRREPDDAA